MDNNFPNNQATFDKVAEHLIKQGRKAINAGATCCYRTDGERGDVLKCAIGCLIPDDMYNIKFEGHGINRLFENFRAIEDYLLAGVGVDLLVSLQSAHDVATPETGETMRDAFRLKLITVAEKFGLDPSAALA